MSDPVTRLVVLLFSGPGVALALAGTLLLASIGLIVASALFEYRPLVKSLLENWNTLASTGGGAEFARRFDEVDRRFASGQAPTVLTRAWRGYRRLLVKTADGELVSPVRAADVFPALDAPARTLEWWANIMVGLGLLITFLGIVAALSESTSAIAAGGGGNGAAVESALLGLLAIAATKFWTSIAGVLSSIILRIVARSRRARIEDLEGDLCEAIDQAVGYMPPERALMEQLAVLRRLETRLGTEAGPAA